MLFLNVKDAHVKTLIARPTDALFASVDREDALAGLSTAQAAERLRSYGPNVIIPSSRRHVVLRWARMLADPMVLLLLLAAAVYAVLGEISDAVVMSAAVLPILAVDVLLEGRAERTLDKLKNLTEPTVTARRDGEWISLSTKLLVPGDLIRIQEGDVLAADCKLVQGSDVIADESALTGESVPISKDASGEDALFAGTVLVSGRGLAEVTATGSATEYGTIGSLVATVKPGPTPLQRSLGQLVRRLFVLALAACIAVVFIGLTRGLGPQQSFIGGVSLAIAAIPEEFPVVYALYLTLGVWRLARKRALIRRMVGVETLGSTSVICTDKTGTLTYGRMELTELWTPEQSAQAERRLLTAAALASEPQPFDPLEQAILRRAPNAQNDADLVHEYAFDPDEKYMSHVWREADGQLRLYAKGAVEGILDHCERVPGEQQPADLATAGLAERGLRVLAVATRRLERVSGSRAQDEAKLTLVGLLGFSDPIRPEIAPAVTACRQAGIRVLMVTGDHPLTARAIAREAGIGEADVFARIRPADKLLLVQELQKQGQTVAMTGDGINDGPALRAADIGIAMGVRGTEVAREAATMVLLDDDFSTIVSAVGEGRRIVTNVRRALGYLVAFHVPILFAAVAAPLAALPLLLEPVHLVWLELVVHPLSSLAFEGDEIRPEVMREPPRPRHAPLMEGHRIIASGLTGLGSFMAVWLMYLVALSGGLPEALARNIAFTTLILGQVGLVLSERAEGHIRRMPGGGFRLPVLLGLTALSTLLIYVPGAGPLLHLQALGAREWAMAAAAALGIGLWGQAIHMGMRRKRLAHR